MLGVAYSQQPISGSAFGGIPGCLLLLSRGGHFPNGEKSFITTTDSDGRATAHLVAGGLQGFDAQVVTAKLANSESPIRAGFSLTAFVPGEPGNTRISGIVTDTEDSPLAGVTVRVDGTTRQAVTDAKGKFLITEAPVGPVHLVVDGSTIEGSAEYPTLSYNLVTVSGVENPLTAPVYMVKLNTASMKYADGAREGYLSVTPNGMQPQFIVTIQPTGAMFDPPAKLTLPNVDGYAPGRQVEMFSYDHDLEEFVAIGLGTVSKNGKTVTSNPGVGVVKAGWHCGAQAGGSGTSHDCPECYKCGDDDMCVEDPAQYRTPVEKQTPQNCKTETCGGGNYDITDTSDKPTFDIIRYDCKKPGCDGRTPKYAKDLDDGDISEVDEYCNKCQSGEVVADESKDGNKIPDRDLCCFDGDWISQRQDYESLQTKCPRRTQDKQREHEIDGCSGPGIQDYGSPLLQSLGILPPFLYVRLPTWGAPQNGVGWRDHDQVMLPCNRHDICYQTCGSDRSQCDFHLADDALVECAGGYPLECPMILHTMNLCSKYFLEMAGCAVAVNVMYNMVIPVAGWVAYEERQEQYCNCCGEIE